jgi:hypothetical protein
MAPVLLLLALAGAAPELDLSAICRSEQKGVPAERRTAVYQDCLHDEQAARDELRQKWSTYPAAARTTCAELGRIVSSYVEALTCIEIKTGRVGGEADPPSAGK